MDGANDMWSGLTSVPQLAGTKMPMKINKCPNLELQKIMVTL